MGGPTMPGVRTPAEMSKGRTRLRRVGGPRKKVKLDETRNVVCWVQARTAGPLLKKPTSTSKTRYHRELVVRAVTGQELQEAETRLEWGSDRRRVPLVDVCAWMGRHACQCLKTGPHDCQSLRTTLCRTFQGISGPDAVKLLHSMVIEETSEAGPSGQGPAALPGPTGEPEILWVHKLSERAVVPASATKEAAGYDLASMETVVVKPGASSLVQTGLVIKMAQGTYGRVGPGAVWL